MTTSYRFVRFIAIALGAACVLVGGTRRASAQDAEPTRVMVRAVAQDAKVIQDPVGGARIVVRERATGRVLAEGIQRGGSGSTEQIMQDPREQGEDIYDTEGAAGFLATFELDRPTEVQITAVGPLRYPQAMQRTSKTMVLVPGQKVLGDGVVLTLHGFIVDIQSPEEALVEKDSRSIPVRATVEMMCGCPTKPGGLWDADEIDVEAQLVSSGEVVRRVPMQYAGTSSTYEAKLHAPSAGAYTLRVTAADADNVNFGMYEKQVVVVD